ncbi:MAG TPA: SBBP repeat-containing protein, partial [Planctomycetota bacterium]|nr:SBBP repeat-containing protein [Planctomycetota bacterium]
MSIVTGLAVLASAVLGIAQADVLAGGKLDGPARAKALQLFAAAPAAFIENTGQVDDPSIRYVFNGSGANVFHTTSGPVFQVFQRVGAHGDIVGAHGVCPGADAVRPYTAHGDIAGAHGVCPRADAVRPYTFSASFPGARQIRPVGLQLLETKINYCLGADHSRWRENVPTFGVVVYEGLYDGIDLHTWGRRSNLKYEFHVAPGADWRQIRIRYTGIAGLSLAKDGSLIVDVGDGWGSLTDDAPVIYQQIAGKRVNLPGRFVLIDKLTYAFEIDAEVEAGVELVIDPEVAWSTYLGGSGTEYIYGVALDSGGNVAVTGYTGSSGWVSGGFDIQMNGCDAFAAKLSPSGQHLWSTYLGGDNDDYGMCVAVDSANNVVATGYTNSSGWVSGGYDTAYNYGIWDAFVVKLGPAGTHLWSTYLGGNADDAGHGVAVDASQNVFVTGETHSSGWISGGFDSSRYGVDGFLVKLSPTGAHLWSTYLGSSGEERGRSVATDVSGNVIVTGRTSFTGWPWISNGFDTSYNGGSYDVFVIKLTASGVHVWSTYLGGSGEDVGNAVAVDASGNVLVTGNTDSSDWVAGGFDTSFNGFRDAFVAKISSEGEHLWCTYLGGTYGDSGYGIAVEASGNVLVTGSAGWVGASGNWVSGGFDTTFNGGTDAFVAKLSSQGAHIWSSFLGGGLNEIGYGIVVDTVGNITVGGMTESAVWASGGYDTSFNGARDAFVARVTKSQTLTVDSAPSGCIQITGSKPGMTRYSA